MKIVFIGGRNIHRLGGIENYMYNLATQLVKMGHEPIVFCESDYNGEESVNGFRVIHQKCCGSFFCKIYVGLKATAKALFALKNIDIFHYNTWAVEEGCIFPKLLGYKTVVQIHSQAWQHSKYSRWKRRIMSFENRLSAFLNRHLIMVAEHQRVFFEKEYGRVGTVIPCGIDCEKKQLSQDSFHNIFPNVKKNHYFLIMARFAPVKNIDVAIQAFNNLNIKGYQLVIAGDNPDNPEYTGYLKNLAIDNTDIVFTGSIYGEKKEMLLANAFSFLLPSTSEGMPITLLEAAIHNLPLILSNIPANKSLISEHEAYWVEPENELQLCKAMRDSIMCPINESTIAHISSRFRERYSWEKVADRYVSYINSITK